MGTIIYVWGMDIFKSNYDKIQNRAKMLHFDEIFGKIDAIIGMFDFNVTYHTISVDNSLREVNSYKSLGERKFKVNSKEYFGRQKTLPLTNRNVVGTLHKCFVCSSVDIPIYIELENKNKLFTLQTLPDTNLFCIGKLKVKVKSDFKKLTDAYDINIYDKLCNVKVPRSPYDYVIKKKQNDVNV